MTTLERERRNEAKKEVKGQISLYVVDIGRQPCNKSYFCIRETRCGYYVQSFQTVVLYVSKKSGKITNTWGNYTRGTMVHINKALEWITKNTQTIPQFKRLSGNKYCELPVLRAGAMLYDIA